MGNHRTRNHRAEVRAYMAEHHVSYTAALRALKQQGTGQSGAAPDPASTLLHPPADLEFGGHDFGLDPTADLFKCWMCGRYEVSVRADDGSIAPCTGMEGYGGDTERVYLLLTLHPRCPDWAISSLTWTIGETGIGRTPQFGCRSERRLLLVESAPSVVNDLRFRIEQVGQDGKLVSIHRVNASPAVASIDVLTAEEGRQVIAENYTAYVAKYGEPQR